MKQIARLDYLDIQIYDELKTTPLVPQKDEDGLAYNSTLFIYYNAYNSRFALVAYGKASQIKREKGTDYLERFLKCYGLTALPDDLINLELRALGTDCCAEITEAITQKIDPEILKTLMVAQATKRIKLSPAIQNLITKVSI